MIAGIPRSEAKNHALELLSAVGILSKKDNKPAELSGGEQQRVAIARALINNPDILLADEPTGNLDSANSDSFMDLLNMLREQYSLTLVIATHSRDIANRSDRILTMADGRIISS
jgi:lipoprotein-releasing system ATP-binding protein